jgi:outer membrane lipoprotein SlyB
MNSKLAVAALATMTVALSTPSLAQDHHYDRDYDRHDRTYHGHGGHYRERCGGGNGAVGTVAGGVGGAVVGNALGGGTLGTVAGGVGGALLGRHFDKQHTRSRNGC